MSFLQHLLGLVLIAGLALSQSADCVASTCKVTPSSRNWPSQADWNALNQSVSGRLITPVPPGAVCHLLRPEFDLQACMTLKQQWSTGSYHALEPISVDYNDDTCPPNVILPCSPDGYPAYIIAAVNANDIQQGVRFAARTGVRLVVKGTGHDVPGR